MTRADDIRAGATTTRLSRADWEAGRCNRCPKLAETTVTTRVFGPERVCSGCARVLLADRQCMVAS